MRNRVPCLEEIKGHIICQLEEIDDKLRYMNYKNIIDSGATANYLHTKDKLIDVLNFVENTEKKWKHVR